MKNQRALPFVLAATNSGTMILNYLDRNQNSFGTYGVGYQYLQTGSFDPEEVSNALALLNFRRKYFGDGVLALDCGANIGAHTIEWAIEMTYWGGVMAFEAQERIFYALAGNIAINNCFNAKALNVALGNSKNKKDFIEIPLIDYKTASSFGSFELRQNENTEFIGQDLQNSQKTKIPLISIDSLELERIDLIKIDVEKMEVEVLQGALKSIEKHRPILIIEIIKSDQKQINKLLEPFDYEIFPFGMNILAVHKEDPCLKHINI